jgi:hypothetical protein
MSDWETVKNKLFDKIDELFPKIKPNGVNKGRGEAMVLVGLAIYEYEKLLHAERTRILKEIEGRIKGMKSSVAKIDYTKMKGRIWNCIECGKDLRDRRGHPVRCLKCAMRVQKDRQIAKGEIRNQTISDILSMLKEKGEK